MKLTKKGFTLIELLVVIAIIGILATWAVWVYTSQLQKARDTTRTTDLNNLRGAIEQYYQDTSLYPTGADFAATETSDTATKVASFLQKLPEDPKNGEPCAAGKTWGTSTTNTAPACAIAYMVDADSNGVGKWAYEISIAFENKGNADTKANFNSDNGDDNSRYEHTVGKMTGIVTKIDKGTTKKTFTTAATSAEKELVVITKSWAKKAQ